MKKYNLLLLVSVLLFLLNSCYYDNKEDLYQYSQTEPCVIASATFVSDIAPIMASECYSCHSNMDQQGNINLEGYDNVKKYVDDGSLLGSIEHTGGFSIMPPSGVKIPKCDIEKVQLWITDGALNN